MHDGEILSVLIISVLQNSESGRSNLQPNLLSDRTHEGYTSDLLTDNESDLVQGLGLLLK